MTDLRNRLADSIRANPDVVVVGLLLLVLALGVINFLWARRAARLTAELALARRVASELSAAAKSQARVDSEATPGAGRTVDRGGRLVYTVADAAAGAPAGARPAPATPAAPAPPAPPAPRGEASSWALAEERTPEEPALAEAAGGPALDDGRGGRAQAQVAHPRHPEEADAAARGATARWADAPMPTPTPAPTHAPGDSAGWGIAPTPGSYEDAWALRDAVAAHPEQAEEAPDPAAARSDPGAENASWSAAGEAVAASGPRATPPDILLVEDDENVGKVYRLLMESKGLAVRQAFDGIDGLDQARARRPDLVLLDMMMPRMNGMAFLETIRKDEALRDLPVVVLSNFREQDAVDQALALGAIEYMVKAQTRPEALLAAIPRWLRGQPAFRTS